MLRRMDFFDVPVILEIENRCFKNPWSAFAFWELMSNEDCYCIVMANKKIIGYGMACLEEEKIHILNIAVEKEERRKGIGTRILQDMLEYGASNKKRRAFLEVRRRNCAAISFYERHHFNKIGVKRRYYSDDDAIIMERLMG
ncbi:MAG: ribosomal-protein-alanine N-acetyltransferase [Candidatus Cloacimonadota bacterium]|nr:MAG: ribosomal-protein-alanine N-acetyltransferase [Candidatus Cloacimonadota bacterium]